MKKILVIGSGKSAVTLIDYLLNESVSSNWNVTIADYNVDNALKSAKSHINSRPISFDINDVNQRNQEIDRADIVVSMLPASMHLLVAKACVSFRKNLVTASYVSKEIYELNNLAKENGIILLNEIGLDPGIDHMSAMKVIDDLKSLGANITSFKSFCGGLIHPDFDNNPWNYKFTWNPRNVVLAGQGTAQYLLDENYKYIPYNKLFKRTEIVNILNEGEFEAYANRDSLSYRESYGLENISTMFRGTLRKRGFCKAWDIFVQLGMTSDEYKITNSEPMNCSDFTKLFLPTNDNLSLAENLCNYLSISKNSDEFKKIEWLGIFSNDILGLDSATPAQFLQLITEKKLSLEDNDKDMIVMQHQFKFSINNKFKRLNSSLIVYGDNQRNTAMAKTVGLPVAISVKLILNGSIKSVGVKIPTSKDIYIPILKELEENGVNFIEEYSDLK
jgi:saccharopine dehydrogenase-like NADP-dependent oxidoreductase|tara:strand:- start:677 stop:2014 length:1338 start_codon:yes stop_codon:yes gene_type:complete